MTFAKFALIALLGSCPLGCSEELGEGHVDGDGRLQNQGLTFIERAPGAANFFLDDPMDSHDFTHVSSVRKTFLVQFKMSSKSSKVASLEEALRPIFVAMPKDSRGRLKRGTARYALHRLFSQRQGWAIKGLQPAGNAWMMSNTVQTTLDNVPQFSKYMVPSFLQELMLEELGVSGFDLHSLAVLAATLEHLIHSEMIDLVYAVYKTLQLPIPGKRTNQQVDDILDTFMMVYVFGVNLEVSNLDDVTNARLHLNSTHPAWPQLRAFAQEIKRSVFATSELDFGEIVRVVESIGAKYVEWQGKDCSRLKDELARKPRYSKGGVKLSWISPIVVNGRRELLTESAEALGKLGVLRELHSSHRIEAELIIPNYINSQSMCLSTASFYAACCINECDGLLAKLEREVGAPLASPEKLRLIMETLLQVKLDKLILLTLEGLKDQATGLVSIHSRSFARWMHNAFPLQCPTPDVAQNQKVASPKTPDEWMSESHASEDEFQQMTKQFATALGRYATMGSKTKPPSSDTEENLASFKNSDVLKIVHSVKKPDEQGLVHYAVHLSAIASIIVLSVALVKSGRGQIRCLPLKGKKIFVHARHSSKKIREEMDLKEIA